MPDLVVDMVGMCHCTGLTNQRNLFTACQGGGNRAGAEEARGHPPG